MIDSDTALVIKINDRFLSSLKNDRIQTSWSLAGASHFLHRQNKRLELAIAILEKKKKKYRILQVYLHEFSAIPKEALGYT